MNVHDSAILEDSLPPKEKDPGSFTIPCYINNICFEKALADPPLEASVSDFVVLDMLEDIKVPLILERPFLSTAHAKIDVTRATEWNLDLEALPTHCLTIEDGEVIDEPIEDIVKTRNDDDKISNGIDEYPTVFRFDRKIHIDYAYNLQFSCMIGFEHVNANFFPILSINVMSKKFYNSIMKDKIEHQGKNDVGAFINAPIFVGNFFVITDFAGVENMDAYRG
ncbi:hypothetical protein Tco_1492816 [Tanacetum coccineum]